MSSFDWPALDIRDAIHVAYKIRDTWFEKIKQADAQYLDFGKDVIQFAKLLERFSTAIENTSAIRAKELSDTKFREWDGQLYHEMQEVVGNFFSTLQDCNRLLQRNTKYLSRSSQGWVNAKWHLGGSSDEAERLRRRLQLHAAKINLLIDFDKKASTVRLVHQKIENLPGDMSRTLNGDEDSEDKDNLLPPVPPILAGRYKQALNFESPSTYHGLGEFPLVEGLDAFITAYEASTVRSPVSKSSLGTRTPSVEEMNNLIKARWIFDRLLNSTFLKRLQPQSIWNCALDTTLTDLKNEYRQWREVLEQNTRTIAALNPEFFRIWIPTEGSAMKLVTDPDDSQMEEKILEAPLQSSSEQYKKDLIVFRRPKNEFRILTYTSLNSSSGDTTIHDENKVFNLHSAQIIPRYARPPYGSNLNAGDFELCSPGASSGDMYKFLREDDRYAFQHALLGYKVVYRDRCHWYLHRSLMKSKIEGDGLVQIFQAKRIQFPSATEMGNSPISPLRSRQDSTMSDATVISNLSRISTRMSTHLYNESFIAEYPRAPLAVIYTKIEGKPTFLRIELTHDVSVRPKRCDCGSHNDEKKMNCHNTVLESSSAFPIRKFSAPSEPKWNLALLCNPQHPEFKDKMEKVNHVNYLNIETSSLASDFQEAIKKIMKIRDHYHREFESGGRVARAFAETRISPDASSSAMGLMSPSQNTRSSSSASVEHEKIDSSDDISPLRQEGLERFRGDEKEMSRTPILTLSTKFGGTSTVS